MGRSIDLGKVMVTLADSVWNARTSYEILTAVYHNGDGYISRRDNIGVEPGSDDSVWYRIVKQGQIPHITFDTEGNMYADDILVTTVFADVIRRSQEAVENVERWKKVGDTMAEEETKRKNSEDERAAAENARARNEQNRKVAEESRVSNENVRQNNEQERVLAESQREDRFEEAMRQAASTMRKGDRGYSAYEIAVLEEGFVGTKAAWLASLVGPAGDSAYAIAVQQGYAGTKDQWLASLIGPQGKSAYQVAVDNGFEGTISEWLLSLKGAKGDPGKDITSIEQTSSSSESEGSNVITVTLSDGTTKTFTVKNGKRGLQGVPGVANAKYKQVAALPTASAATMDFIYLVESATAGVYNMSYTEEDAGAYSWKSLGTTAIQLVDYATKQEVSQLGKKSNIVQTANVELRGAIINSSGAWTATTYYRHIILPVTPGMLVNYTANADKNSYYAFLTSDETPVAYAAAPLVAGTERILVEPGARATLIIPEGTNFLYLSGGDTRTGTGRGNLPATITLSQTLDTRLAELEEVGTELDETIGEEDISLSDFTLRTGALSDSNTWLNAARYYHILLPVVVGDVVTLTANAAYPSRYGFLKNDEQAVTYAAAPVVQGTYRIEVAAKSTVTFTIPEGCKFLYLYGGDGSLGTSHLREHLPASVSVRSSVGALLDVTSESGVQYSGNILAFNPDVEWLPKMVAAKKRYYTSSTTDKPSPIVFAHLSDIHGNWANVKRFVDFTKHHEAYIDGLLNTGDTAIGLFTDGIYIQQGMRTWVAPIMNVVGNHDTRGANGWQQYVGLDIYNALIAPYVDGWGVIQPADAATNGYCYYYKDYAQSLRLVVVDIMGYDATEDAWLDSTLADAKTNGYHVVIATHFAGSRDSEHQDGDAFNVVECNYSTLQITKGNAAGLFGYNALAYMMTSTVKDFIDGGGKFVGYIQGHYHLDFVAKLAEDPRQLIYAVGSSKYGETRDYNHVGATRMQDEFQIISIDTYMNTVRLFKVGANIDQFGRLKNSVCINYESGTVIAQGF